MTQKIGKSGLTKILVLVLALALAGVASIDFYTHRHTKETVVAAEGLTEMRMLSEWVPSLKGTFGDTPVFFYDSGVEGATVLYVGGTHPYEPAASLSAYVLLENAKLTKGRMIIIPQANRSATPTGMLGNA